MTDKQPEALRLADELEKYVEVATAIAAVAELRRLHALNAELLEALKKLLPMADALNAELLRTLRGYTPKAEEKQ